MDGYRVPSLHSDSTSGVDLAEIIYKLCIGLLILASLSSLCYNDRAEPGGGGPRADIVVLYLCRCGRSRDRRVELRLVFGGGTSHGPQVPNALREVPQEEDQEAKSTLQIWRLPIIARGFGQSALHTRS
jgi:hypothetical protein